MKKNNLVAIAGNRGFLKLVIIIVVALLILSYYGFDLRKTVESPTTQSNFDYLTTWLTHIWESYLKTPAMYLWNLFLSLISAKK